METSNAERSNAGSPYDLERLSPRVRAAVTKRIEEVQARLPVGKFVVDGVFNLGYFSISEDEVAYYTAYARLAVQQLVLGDFFGDEEPVRDEESLLKEIAERPLERHEFNVGRANNLGYSLLHDITHTWVELAQSETKEPADMVPKFLRYKRSMKEGTPQYEASSDDEAVVCFYNIDGGFRTRGGILKSVSKAKSREQFLSHDYLQRNKEIDTRISPFRAYVRGRIFDEYGSNKRLLWDIFVEATEPLMREYFPRETAALRKKAQLPAIRRARLRE